MLCDRLDLGGAETHVVTLANRLSEQGHEVTVVSGGGRLVDTLSGVKHITLPLFRKSAILGLFFSLWRLFRRERFDVIHAHTRFSALLSRPLARARLAVTAHWVFDTRFPKKQLTHWGRETLAVSPDVADYLVDAYGLKRERITVTVNGIDTARFFPLKRKTDVRRIVCCTRLDHDRADAAFALLEAMEVLNRKDVSLTVIGDGDRFEELKQRWEALQQRCPTLDVRLLGGVADVAPHVRDADIFVGVSRAALEGMAAGCATVLAGNEGYLSIFFPMDAEMAEKSNFCCRGAEGITKEKLVRDLSHLLAMSRRELLRMGEENRRYVCKRYGVDRMVRSALSVYERICKRVCVLCGYYGYHNVGDALLSRALSLRLRERGYGKVLLLSAKHLSPRALFALWRGYDLILGGGNLVQDATSRRSLRFYLYFATHARRFELYGGIGPLTPEGESLTKAALRRAVCVHARTEWDFFYAKRLGAPRVRLSADTVLSLPFPPKEKGENILLAFRAPDENEAAAISAFALYLCRTFGKERICIFSMHPSDYPFSERLASLCRIEHRTGDGDDLIALLKDCRLVVASRLHAGICALGMGVPFLLWEGEEKCRAFVEDARALSKENGFCGLFSFRDRPKELPEEKGIKEARRRMRARI